MSKEPIIYSLPEDISKELYYVPVVFKNKDHLTGYIDGMNIIMDMQGLSIYNQGNMPAMGSDRFNDMLKEGKRVSELTDVEFKKYVQDRVKEQIEILEQSEQDNSEFAIDIFDDYYFYVSCTCGNFIAWNTDEQLPNENCTCDMCGKLLIHYTGHNDRDYIYDGSDIDIEFVVQEVLDGIFNNDEED